MSKWCEKSPEFMDRVINTQIDFLISKWLVFCTFNELDHLIIAFEIDEPDDLHFKGKIKSNLEKYS